MAINKIPSGNYGSTITAGASDNAKGSYTQLTASTSEAVQAVIINVLNTNSGTNRFLIDIAVGASGSESVVIANVLFECGFYVPTNNPSVYIPVGIANGSRIAARCQGSIHLTTCDISLNLIGGTSSATVNTYGATTSTTNGTQVDPGGSANTKGSYVQLTASSSAAIDWLATMINQRGDSTPQDASFELDIATGAAASETVIVPGLCFRSEDQSGVTSPLTWSLPVSIATSTRIAARAASSTTDATDRLFDVMVYGSSPLPSSGSSGAVQLVNGGLVS